MKYPDMQPSAGSGRLSLLAIQPRNMELSAERRSQLLEAFEQLPPDRRADLLEAVETMVFRLAPGVDIERDQAKRVIREVYAINGWEG